MLDKLLGIFVYFLIVACLVVIHEIGHYMFGRMLGIPKDKMTFGIQKMTPHVALMNDNLEKIPPSNLDAYVPILEKHLKSDFHMFLFAIGGHLTELIGVFTLILLSFVINSSGLTFIAKSVAWIAPLLALNYLLMDCITSYRRGAPSGGDFSGSWSISQKGAYLFYGFYFFFLLSAVFLTR